MDPFQYVSHANRVIFGQGKRNLAKEELVNLGIKKAIVIATPQQVDLANEIGEVIAELCGHIYTDAVQHVPIETVKEAQSIVERLNIDGLVAVGGGSSIGLAKAIALDTSLPILAIPTTYAGSEMTPVWGITENNIKKTGTNVVVKPKAVIYDPELTITLPQNFAVTSGMNAIAHCAEGLYAENANPIISLFAEEGVRALSNSLPKIIENPDDMDARSEAQYGTMLGGMVLGSVGMALHHKLCHTLGGTFNLPHAETHTVILPYAIQYNAEQAPKAIKALARALQTTEKDVPGALFDLAHTLGISMSLKDLGMKKSDLNQAAELATKNPYYNPRVVTKGGIKELLQLAFEGKRPISGMISAT
jgi:alcohol dehydrogenase class IV